MTWSNHIFQPTPTARLNRHVRHKKMRKAHYRTDVFSEQLPLVYSFTRHVLYYRILNDELKKMASPTPFWVDTANAHILQAFIQWCMVFGSTASNKIHWHALAVENQDDLRKAFRDGLCAHLKITATEWGKYWKEMIEFRNQYVAHRDFDIKRPVPMLDRALEVAFYFDSWVRELIAPDIIEGKTVRELFESEKAVVASTIINALKNSLAEQNAPADGLRPPLS